MDPSSDIRPRLRPVEVHPVGTDDGQAYAVADPLGIAPNRLVVTAGALMVMNELDGTASVTEVSSRIHEKTGYRIPVDQIEKLVATLDEGLFLRGDRYQSAYDAHVTEFARLQERPAVLSGSAYPSDPGELTPFLEALLTVDDSAARYDAPKAGGEVRAVVVPHIDLKRGGPSFASAYREIARSDAETFVILGIAHQGDEYAFNITSKDFTTPLGTVQTDRDFIARLRELAPPEALGSELPHRNEHSIEFQALLLRHVFSGRNISIVPVLCGALHTALLENTPPMHLPEFRGFVEAMVRVIRESHRRVCIIASVDLAHVGRRFGDERGVDREELARIQEEDRALLDIVSTGDSDRLFREVAKDRNVRNICGYPALYTTLCILDPGLRATLLDYRQSVEGENDSVVTFASMVFEQQTHTADNNPAH